MNLMVRLNADFALAFLVATVVLPGWTGLTQLVVDAPDLARSGLPLCIGGDGRVLHSRRHI